MQHIIAQAQSKTKERKDREQIQMSEVYLQGSLQTLTWPTRTRWKSHEKPRHSIQEKYITAKLG